jgi:hypothetical protein
MEVSKETGLSLLEVLLIAFILKSSFLTMKIHSKSREENGLIMVIKDQQLLKMTMALSMKRLFTA